jgi:hypothetical protein
MKNLLKTSILLSLFALIYSGCSSTKVISDQDPAEDFTQIKTFEYYGWADNSDQMLNRFDKERIESAFAEEGKKRGLTQVDSNGDVIVILFISGEMKTQTTANTNTMGMGGMGGRGRGMRSPGWGWGATHSTTTINETNYLEGTLMIEMYNRADQKLIFGKPLAPKLLVRTQKNVKRGSLKKSPPL